LETTGITPRSTHRDGLGLATLALALVAVKAVLTRAAGVELHYDEAQYWEWSRQLDWSYYSKGPLVAWLIALSESLFGHGEWQVRLPAWLAHGALLAVVFHFARDVWQSRAAAWWAVWLTLFTPLYFTLGLVMTTDIWLFLCWTWGLWAVYRALIFERPRAWFEVGAAVGLGALTKLSIGLLPAAVGIAVLLHPRWRAHLKLPQLWGGLLLMLIIMSPVLAWNATHDWVMFRHEGGHVGRADWSVLRALSFLLEQAVALSPVVVLIALPLVWRPPKESGPRLIWGLSLAWLAFFVFKALGAKVQVNWPAASYIGLLILFAGHIPALAAWQRRALFGGFALALALMFVAYFPYALGLHQDPFKDTKAWRAPVTALGAQTPPVQFILTPNYKLAAEVAFYWPDYLPVYVAGDSARRFNQHDLWPSIAREAGRDGLWVSTSPEAPPELTQAFAHCTSLPAVPAITPDGGTLRTLYARHCREYRAIAWPRPGSY